MKILHTADWHIGKTLNGVNLLAEQEHALIQIIDYLKTNTCDSIIIAGDIYDRSIPSAEATALVNKILNILINEIKIPTFIIAGNHDNAQRLGFGSEIFKHNNLYISNNQVPIQKINIGDIDYYLSPFFDYLKIGHYYEEIFNDSEEAFVKQLSQLTLDKNKINILIAHNFFASVHSEVDESESERPLSIGGKGYINAKHLLNFDYVALGHLHKPQKVHEEFIRYSGSIYKYSESEVNHKKSFTIIDIDKNKFSYTLIPFHYLKDVKIIQGYYSDIKDSKDNNYIFFHLLDEHPVINAMNLLKQNYPNALGIKYINQKQNTIIKKEISDLTKIDYATLFADYFLQTNQKEISSKQETFIKKILVESEDTNGN